MLEAISAYEKEKNMLGPRVAAKRQKPLWVGAKRLLSEGNQNACQKGKL